MLRWGVTGGIGAGKSAAGQILVDRGVPLLDTDDVARAVVEPGTSGLQEVRRAFGDQVLQANGRLDRGALARIVFNSPERRAELESILHPRIYAEWKSWLEVQERAGERLACVVIPLLFEKGYAHSFDQVVAVGCTKATQRLRLLNRGWDDVQIAARLEAQWPTDRKLASASRVVWNEGTPALHALQWERLLAAGLEGWDGSQIGR